MLRIQKNELPVEEYIFDIPIYRCPVAKHTQELLNAKNLLLQSLVDLHGQEALNSNSYNGVSNHFDRVNWYPWRYNEIIGYIRLYKLGSQLRGELWFTNAKRIRKDLKNKKIYFRDKAFERYVGKNQSSNDIFDIICEELTEQENDSPTKGRYLDKEMFYRTGRFINWRELFDT